MRLIGDIGGTHARLALAAPDSTNPVAEKHLATADFPDFAAALTAYLATIETPITSGCLAVAGPIEDNGRRARLTNLPWVIDCAVLEQRFSIAPLVLVNDFAAAAMGVTAAPSQTIVPLQAGKPLTSAPKLVIGAGTGLGMAILTQSGGSWQVIPGEGGHIGYAPLDEKQDKVYQALRQQHGRVTAERIVSGPGLSAIHRILTGITLDAAEITHRAMRTGDQTALDSLNIFFAAYGAIAGDIAMAVLARGGVYLAGGIAAKLLSLLPSSPFLATFNAKAEHTALVSRMPVAVVTDGALGLRGAALLAGGVSGIERQCNASG